MTPVDPVVRAKLADWLWQEVGALPSDEAASVADALLALPPSARAQLLGLEGLEQEHRVLYVLKDGSRVVETHTAADPERSRVFGLPIRAAVVQATRFVTPWLPVPPNPKDQP